MYSELLSYEDISEYEGLYCSHYCEREIKTHDGFTVKFRKEDFAHAFYSNASRRERDKSIFSYSRAHRLLWIEKVLKDEKLVMYAGWDSKRKRYDHSRRVTLITQDGYVVVLRSNKKGFVFVTAYLIDEPENQKRIEESPIWNREHTFS
jgi:hypothetical protein